MVLSVILRKEKGQEVEIAVNVCRCKSQEQAQNEPRAAVGKIDIGSY